MPILPLRIEDVAPSASMEYYISETHWLDAVTPPLERHLGRVADTVAVLLDRTRRAAEDSGAAPPEDAPAVAPASPNTWTDLNPTGDMPPARSGHALAYDSTSGKAFLFGGEDVHAWYNDTWAWTRSQRASSGRASGISWWTSAAGSDRDTSSRGR